MIDRSLLQRLFFDPGVSAEERDVVCHAAYGKPFSEAVADIKRQDFVENVSSGAYAVESVGVTNGEGCGGSIKVTFRRRVNFSLDRCLCDALNEEPQAPASPHSVTFSPFGPRLGGRTYWVPPVDSPPVVYSFRAHELDYEFTKALANAFEANAFDDADKTEWRRRAMSLVASVTGTKRRRRHGKAKEEK